MLENDFNKFFMNLALEQGKKCTSTATAYNVGAVLVNATVTSTTDVQKLINQKLVFTGYSRELPGNTHAEQVCLMKHEKSRLPLSDYILFTTMEPCTERLSGKLPCAQNIIDRQGKHLNIIKLVMACKEPPHFVNGKGISVLQKFGLSIQRLDQQFEIQALSLNSHVLKEQ